MNSMLFNAGGDDVAVQVISVPARVPARKASRIAPTLALRCE